MAKYEKGAMLTISGKHPKQRSLYLGSLWKLPFRRRLIVSFSSGSDGELVQVALCMCVFVVVVNK